MQALIIKLFHSSSKHESVHINIGTYKINKFKFVKVDHGGSQDLYAANISVKDYRNEMVATKHLLITQYNI